MAFSICLLLLAHSIWRVVFGAKKQGSLGVLFLVLLVGSASILTVDLIQISRTTSSFQIELVSDFACLVLFSALVMYSYRVGTHSGTATFLRRNVHSWTMMLIAIAMTGWCYHRIEIRSTSYDLVGSNGVLPGTVDVDDRAFAVTDRGVIVPLYRLSTSEDVFDEYVLSDEDKFKSFNHTGIHRNDADRMSNCHGWVFTAGQFLLKGRDVDRILSDNNYFVVSNPRIDDIVIYRDDVGQILHTALVQGVLRDGTVITESKWGIDERFLHLPTDQPYSQTFDYYRTARPNHLIKILNANDVESIAGYEGLLDG